MRIGEVIGKVTLSRWHPSLAGASYRLVVPFTLAELLNESEPRGESLVVYDELGAGQRSRIAIAEAREAAQPFYPEVKPIDAYNAAILDTLDIRDPEDLLPDKSQPREKC